MSILIKGVEMPKNCMECEWRDAEACGECELMIGNPFKSFAEQYAHCPFQMMAKRHALVPVPPHGDLIGREWLIDIALHLMNTAKNDDIANGVKWLWQYIIDAPTIIEAEGE